MAVWLSGIIIFLGGLTLREDADLETVVPTEAKPKRILSKTVVAGILILMICFTSIGMSALALMRVIQVKNEANSPREVDTRINQLDTRINTLDKALLDLKFDLAFKKEDPALLSSDSLGSFTVVNTRVGPFLISLENIETYLDGYKLNMKIGNISAAKFSGYKLRVLCKSIFEPEKDSDYKEFSFPGSLEPTTWTNASVIIAPAKPEDIKFIKVYLQTDTVWMKN
jgi:hypothetical protein